MVPHAKTRSELGLKLGLSVAAGLAFLLSLALGSYLRFPKRMALFMDPGQPAPVQHREFSLETARPENLWTLEVELPLPAGGRRVFEVVLNGQAIGTVAPSGRVLILEFQGARLSSGLNTLDVRSEEPWTFRRLRVKEFSGYASGFPSAVIFPRGNRYPEAAGLPPGLGTLFVLAVFFLLTAAANGVAEAGEAPVRRPVRLVRGARYLIPAALVAALALPAFARFRIWFGWTTVIILWAAFVALAFLPQVACALKTAFGLVRRALARLAARAAGPASVAARRLATNEALAVFLIAALAFVSLVRPGPVVRSGDSLEYVSMLVSWAEFGRPYVTADSAARMDARLGRPAAADESAFFSDLKQRFPSLLKNGSEMDLPHFWFYSLAAAAFYYPVRLVGLNIGFAFMLLHLFFVAAGYFVVRRALGSAAAVGFLLVVCFSPLIWFVNKIHVELFTVVLASVGAALLAAENWAGSALTFALASTQNPPFAILAGLTFLLGFWRRRWAVLKGKLPFWIIAFVLAALQPAYYWLRLGIINPVVATGAADMSRDALSLRKMLSVIVDPDIGLLANWPVALLLLLAFAFQAARKRARFSGPTWIFLLASLPVLLWSQSRTLNLNHGGTYFISRYSLWYLFVFFLVIWQVGVSLRRSTKVARRAWFAAGVLAASATVVQFWPARPEEYLRPTRASLWIYGHAPGLYDPMPEIFTERYRRIEENLPENVWAVSHPSGNKILVRRGRMMNFHTEEELPEIATCPELDKVRVYWEAWRRFEAAPARKYIYINGLGRELRRAAPAAVSR